MSTTLLNFITQIMRCITERRIVVGLAAATVGAATAKWLALPISVPLLSTVFTATVLIYELDSCLDRRSNANTTWTILIATTGITATLLVWQLSFLRVETQWMILIGLLLSVSYAVPVSWLGGKRLKDHPVAKSVYVASGVSIAVLTLPCLEAGLAPSATAIVAAATWCFLVILGNSIACDLRDLQIDRVSGLKTIAVSLGDRLTRECLRKGYLLACFAGATLVYFKLLPGAALIPLSLTLGALYVLRRDHPRWVWGFCLDGAFLPMIWLI